MPTTASGFLAGAAGIYHHSGTAVPDTNIAWDALAYDAARNIWRVAGKVDQVGFRADPNPAGYPPTGYGAGSFAYSIPWNYYVTNDPLHPNNTAVLDNVSQQADSDVNGKATTTKGGVTATANAVDPYVGPFGRLW